MNRLALVTFLAASISIPATALDTKDLLALIAMPLAVAEVSNLTGVPADRLTNALAVLSGANLRPTEFVQVVQYTPVALTYDERNQTDFVNFMTTQSSDGLTGDRMFDAVTRYFNDSYAIPQTTWTTPQVRETYFTQQILPPVVVRRVEQIRTVPVSASRVGRNSEASVHPHGGPPGQLKKERGLQTGAEIVHGYKPGKGHENSEVRVDRENGHGRGRDKHGEVRRVAPSSPVWIDSGLPPGQAKKNGNGPPGTDEER